ncbi:MAG: LicD family protein [Clostridiales bacterium]|nr:LicD family protein [Clostridiales bacterium]
MNNKDTILLQLQDCLYQMLVEFDSICKEHNLRYYLAYGSLLGAVRHGDFIPWDDDLDVVMPREDYDRLLKTYKEILPSHYDLHNYNNTPNYFLSFAKIVNTDTTLVEIANKKNDYRVGGVYIDIFPLDGMGNCIRSARLRTKKATIYRIMIDSTTDMFEDKKRALWKQLIINITRLFNTQKWQNRLARHLRKKSFNKSKYVSMSATSTKDKKIVKKEIFGEPKKIKFREHYFYAPQMIDEYLKTEYGDYMQLPPIEKRCSHHNFVYIDLNLPFEKFDVKDMERKQLRK